MSAKNRKRISGEEAIQNILQFVEEESGDEESDLDELYGDENEINSDTNISCESSDSEKENDDPNANENANRIARRKHRRKQLTYTRLVNSIDSSLSEENFDPTESPTEEKTIIRIIPSQNKKKNTEVKFTNQPTKTTGHQSSRDVISNKPGLSAKSNGIENELQAFQLFFTDEILDIIVSHTNKRIDASIGEIPPDTSQNGKYPHLKPVDRIDVLSVTGLMYLRGLYGLNKHDVRLLFSHDRGIPIFGATMSRLRFLFIMRHFSFDDVNTREQRWRNDRFADLRQVFEMCNKNFGEALVPVDYISLDETLYPARTQVSFKQYNSDKPAKYGVLFKSLNSARSPYTYQTHVYGGKPEEITNESFYVQGTINYIKYLAEQLQKCHSLNSRYITMDRLYTSLEIADWLSARNITMVGTFQNNRVGIPPELKVVKDKAELSNEIYWEVNGKCNISSYVVKTSKGIKAVLMLSTMEPLLGVTKDDQKKKPALYKFYDFTKGETDIVDQKMGSYTVKPKCRR